MLISPNIYKNILLVAGTGRNIGKTTLACNLIAHFSKTKEIIGLKITSMYPDELAFHGNKETELNDDFEISEEKLSNPRKDTFRMKQAGAKRVFFVRTKDIYMQQALNNLFQIIDKESIIICESASLRNFIQPGLFLLIRSSDESNIKERSRKLFPLADLIIFSDKPDHKKIVDSIEIVQQGWKFVQ